MDAKELARLKRRGKDALEELKRVCEANLEKLDDEDSNLSDMRYMTSNAIHELAVYDYARRNYD